MREGRSPTIVMPRQRRRSSCCHELRQMIEVGFLRRPRVKARMRALAIVELQISSERSAFRADALVGSQVDLLIFDRPPKPLDENVVTPGAEAIHTDRDPIVQQQTGESSAGELATLVGIENFG